VASLVFILIIALSIAALLQYSTSSRRLTQRRVERENIYYTAEAGVDQVVHWFNFPDEYTDTGLFAKDSTTDTYYDSDDDNVFEDRGLPLTLLNYDANLSEDLIVFTNEPINTGERARVTRLDISLPTSDDLAIDPDSIIVVDSTSTLAEDLIQPLGQRRTRTIRVVLSSDPPFPLVLPAAIISHALLSTDGQFNVHWGQAWSQSDQEISNLNNVTSAWDDPYAGVYTEGWFRKNVKYADGTMAWSNDPLVPADPNYNQPWDLTGGLDEFENLYQQYDMATTVFPLYDDISSWSDLTLDYDGWKIAALDRGLYFSTDASGNIYQGTEENVDTLLTNAEFYDIINQSGDIVFGATAADQVLPAPQIIFVDTIDGQPPNGIPVGQVGSNMCDISLGGGSVFTRGVFYVAGDLVYGGAGSAPTIWAETPDLTFEQIQCNHHGVIYTDGIYDQSGQRFVYGSIVAYGGFGTGGSPDVYYDYRLASGLPFSFNSEVSIARWTEDNPNDVALGGP
jgi:hypothetical protein